MPPKRLTPRLVASPLAPKPSRETSLMTESELRWSGTACSLGDVLVDQCREHGVESVSTQKRPSFTSLWAVW